MTHTEKETKLQPIKTREDLAKLPGLEEGLSNFEGYVQRAKDGISAVAEYVKEKGWDKNTTQQVLISLINYGFSDVEIIDTDEDTVESTFIKCLNAQIPTHNKERQKMPKDIQHKAKELNRYVEDKLDTSVQYTDLYETIYPGALSMLIYGGKRILVVGPSSSHRDLMVDYIEATVPGKIVYFDSRR